MQLEKQDPTERSGVRKLISNAEGLIEIAVLNSIGKIGCHIPKVSTKKKRLVWSRFFLC